MTRVSAQLQELTGVGAQPQGVTRVSAQLQELTGQGLDTTDKGVKDTKSNWKEQTQRTDRRTDTRLSRAKVGSKD